MTVYQLIYGINIVFLVYMFLYAILYFCLTFYAALHMDDYSLRQEHMKGMLLSSEENYIPVSILVPAYNEELTIVDSIDSLLSLDYPEYEIVVVNDGSSDRTEEILVRNFHLKQVEWPIRKHVPCKDSTRCFESVQGRRIILVSKENGGKADALNMGINVSRYPLFVCMDADSVLQRDALKKIAEPFLEEENTVAAGGNIQASNSVLMEHGKVVRIGVPRQYLVLMQIVEYLRVFLTSRISFNWMNANLIISGAFGMYRREAAIRVGGYTRNVIGEDMDLVVKMHAYYRKNHLPYRISYVADAVCWTQVPEKVKILYRQRRRWHIGMGQSLKSHLFMCFNPVYGTVGMLAFPYYLLFEYYAPLAELVGLVTVVMSFALGVVDLQFLLVYFLVYLTFSIIVSCIAILLDKVMLRELIPAQMVWALVGCAVLEAFGYRQLCSVFRVSGLFGGHKNEWGKMERVANRKV